MNRSTELFAQLQALGAGEFEHLNGSLAAHLRGTESLLISWGAGEILATAGLYHAVYGTDGYSPSLTGLEMRQKIVELIGVDAEQLAYLYGACDRRVFYPRIGTEMQLSFADRFTNTEYPIIQTQLVDLCELILANELEIAAGNAQFRSKYGPHLSKLFERMRSLVSKAGFQAYRKLLS